MTKYKLIQGDCIEVMANANAESIDAVICDPPYALSFMGKEWDSPSRMIGDATGISGGFTRIPPGTPRPDVSKNDPLLFQQWCQAWGEQAMRVLKPGGHILAFGATRTHHRLAAGLEDAGFEIRDAIGWIFASGMPKSHNVGLSIDKLMGHSNRGRAIPTASSYQASDVDEQNKLTSNKVGVYEARSPEGEPYVGFGTGLKPAIEIITLARKPFDKKMTVAKNVLEYGTGALNIDAARIESTDGQLAEKYASITNNDTPRNNNVYGESKKSRAGAEPHPGGRWPANVVFDGDAAAMLDDQSSGASRFFFHPKPSTKERRAGLDADDIKHPTQKSVDLMRYLCRLVTPPNGVILDPFLGSGTTGIAALLEGFRFVGIEREEDYMEIARKRIEHWTATREEIEA